MSDQAQNDWDVVEDALDAHFVHGTQYKLDAAHAALDRLREFTKITISGLNERISELEAELDERNEVVVAKEPWPRPANLPYLVTVAIYCSGVFTAARYYRELDAWYCIECGERVQVVW